MFKRPNASNSRVGNGRRGLLGSHVAVVSVYQNLRSFDFTRRRSLHGGLFVTLRSLKFLDKRGYVTGDWLLRCDVSLVSGKEALNHLSRGRAGTWLTAVAKLARLDFVMNDVALND